MEPRVVKSFFTDEGGFHVLNTGDTVRVTGGCRGKPKRQTWSLKTPEGFRVLTDAEVDELFATKE